MSEYKAYILKDTQIWDEYVENSASGTLFHKLEWLNVAAEHSKMRFIPIAVRKGNHIVCLFPFFYRKKYGLRILLSPPNSCGIPHLGPVLNISASNKYKYEHTYIDIIDEITRFVDKDIGYDYLRIIHTPEMNDMRPYIWGKYIVQPYYTYKFDLRKQTEEIYNCFHSTTKNAIRNALKDSEILISKDHKYTNDILSLVEKRYLDQNRKFKINNGYFKKLKDSSIAKNIESIAVIHKERTIAGDITLTDKNIAYAWIGSVNRNENVPGVGELLLWKNIMEYTNRRFTSYDIVGANFRHICKHKAKYGANLINYFVVYKTSLKGKIGLDLMNGYGKYSFD